MSETLHVQVPADAPARPDVLGGVAPYLTVEGADAAGAFYREAFGAREVGRAYAEDQRRLLHLHLYVNGGSLMLMDPFPEYGSGQTAASGILLHLQVDDIETWVSRAVQAGAEVTMPVQLMFWGDLYGQLRDPFGVTWSLGQTPG